MSFDREKNPKESTPDIVDNSKSHVNSKPSSHGIGLLDKDLARSVFEFLSPSEHYHASQISRFFRPVAAASLQTLPYSTYDKNYSGSDIQVKEFQELKKDTQFMVGDTLSARISLKKIIKIATDTGVDDLLKLAFQHKWVVDLLINKPQDFLARELATARLAIIHRQAESLLALSVKYLHQINNDHWDGSLHLFETYADFKDVAKQYINESILSPEDGSVRYWYLQLFQDVQAVSVQLGDLNSLASLSETLTAFEPEDMDEFSKMFKSLNVDEILKSNARPDFNEMLRQPISSYVSRNDITPFMYAYFLIYQNMSIAKSPNLPALQERFKAQIEILHQIKFVHQPIDITTKPRMNIDERKADLLTTSLPQLTRRNSL